jgi:hypothetical protein
MITDKNQAAAIVAANAAITSFPVVELTELTDAGGILDQAVIAAFWVAETVYEIGARVVPTVPNGLLYVLRGVCAGSDLESGVTEPAWPLFRGDGVLDQSLIWECLGRAPEALWDLKLAEHLVWIRKRGLASSLSDVGLDARDQFKRSQVFDHCQAMVESTAPFCTGEPLKV